MNPLEMFLHVFLLLGLPLAVGTAGVAPLAAFHRAARTPMKIFSLFFLPGVRACALGANWQYFVGYVGMVVGVVLVHNASALATGYGLAYAPACRSATGAPCRSNAASRTPASA